MRPKIQTHCGNEKNNNNVDPDQTAPKEQSDRVYTVCSGLFVPVIRSYTVIGTLSEILSLSIQFVLVRC